MRYDEKRGIYRDCKWCGGKGCLACPAEADKEYKRQFPDGPKPIAQFSTADIEGGALGLFKSIFGLDAIMAAKAEGESLAVKMVDERPEIVSLSGHPKDDVIEVLSEQLIGHCIEENLKKLAAKSKKARKFIHKEFGGDK